MVGYIIERPKITCRLPPHIVRAAQRATSRHKHKHKHTLFLSFLLCFPGFLRLRLLQAEWWFFQHELLKLFKPSINNSFRWLWQEGQEALHHNQVQGELDRGRARQVPRSSSTVSPFFSFSLSQHNMIFFNSLLCSFIFHVWKMSYSIFVPLELIPYSISFNFDVGLFSLFFLIICFC